MKTGWQIRALGDVLKLEYGKPLPDEDRDDNGIYPAYGANGIKCRTNKYFHSKRGIIVGRKGSAGEINLTEDKFWPLDVTYFVTYDEMHYDLRFLYHCLTSLRLQRLAVGVKPGLNRNDVYSIKLAFPPLAEQKRIVAILDEAFAGIAAAVANAEKNLANARELFESYLHSIFVRRGAGWQEKPLSTVCEKITVGHVGTMANQYVADGIPFLRSQNIRPFEISMNNVVFIDKKFDAELGKSRLRPGDVAIVRTGYPGTAAVIPPWLETANCSDLVLVRPGKEVDPHYLAAFFNSAYGKEMVLGKLVGAAQKHFNIGAAEEAILHFPAIREQAVIVSALYALRAESERIQRLYQKKAASLAVLKQSILQKAFSGELTANPDQALRDAAA